MKKLTSAQIRQMFLDYFKEKHHTVEPSASLVPKDDPTLLWINSGVATLKKYFDGSVVPENPRLVNAQKAIRTNDIENVGFTARHHTFFEMLGNFSIGDYFKKEAIEYAWEFLTGDEWIGFDADKLFVTVHPEDDEAYDIWTNDIGLKADKIIRLEENFWDIGEGPSGPNTEIFYDRGEMYGNDPKDPELYPGGENERYLEIWNLVFSQFNHNPDSSYTPLPKKNIDTGMGLERITSVIQDVPTNFETDLFMPIIKETEKLAHVAYGKTEKANRSYRVIADHIRTVAFAIGDHALPSNEGRGYVLRRLLRRAVRFAKEIGIEKPFMYKLVPIVGDIMNDFYPEVTEQKEHIANIIEVEEVRFHETLNEGLEILSNIIEKEKAKSSDVFPGEEVFRLYDTYGFPKELTEEYVADLGFTIDEAGYQTEMNKQKERARNARQQVESMHVQDEVLTKIDVDTEFVGYTNQSIETQIVKMIHNGEFVNQATAGDELFMLLRETPFYAESGGQISDTGWIYHQNGKAFVQDVKKAPKGQFMQQVIIKEGTLQVDDIVEAAVEKRFRNNIVKNHTATHLVHQALKDVLGTHVNQAGSLVTPERLRFDFSHFQAITAEELEQIEQIVNEKIWEEIPLVIEHKDIKEAKAMGAMALFGEKYGDVVRVVEIGDYSIELCGGCHVNNTAEIGIFKLVQESGIGAGTRRIEAVTGEAAYNWISNKLSLLHEASTMLKTTDAQVPERLHHLYDEMKDMERENESLSTKLANLESGSLTEQVQDVKGVPLLAEKVDVKDMNQLRNMIDDLKNKLGSSIILLALEQNGKVQLASGVSKDLVERGFHAGHLIKAAAKACGGGGGGRPDMAQAGGKDPNKINDALLVAKDYIKDTLNQ